MTAALVSSEWLNENQNNSDLIILDASQSNNRARLNSKFENKRIKGTRLFDLKSIFSESNGLFSNTLPSQEQFEIGCRNLGINNSSKIVVYDNLGIYTSPRVWWMFKAMGHEKIYVLNGGLPDWIDKGFETVEHTTTKHAIGDFRANLQSNLVQDFNGIKSNLPLQNFLLIDARAEGRYSGTAKEPREGLPSGHIPNSINIPFSSLLENGKYKSTIELKEIFESSSIDDRSLVFSCGSGVTACIVLLASEMVLGNPTAVYDGSWTEWATLNKDGI